MIAVSTTINSIVEEATNLQSTRTLIARIEYLAFGQECDFEPFCIIVSHLFSQTNDDNAEPRRDVLNELADDPMS
jgi:hypothetical protein